MDIRVVELLCSRLCHDLVSPVGAIHNGLELIEEMEDGAAGGFLGEAVSLIAFSAGQAGRRLQFFRLAYGQAGRDLKSYDDARAIAAGWLEGGRTRLDWAPGVPPDATAGRVGLVKTLLNTIVLADEMLPQGGLVTVNGAGGAESGRIAVSAAGRPGTVPPALAAALTGGVAVDGLTPRTVHAYATGRFADAYGIRLSIGSVGAELIETSLEW